MNLNLAVGEDAAKNAGNMRVVINDQQIGHGRSSCKGSALVR